MVLSADPMRFESLILSGWRQFDSIHLDLSSRATVITGANGSGKSTILSVLSKHYNWQALFTSVGRSRGSLGFVYGEEDEPDSSDESDFLDPVLDDSERAKRMSLRQAIREQLGERDEIRMDQPFKKVGGITYSDGAFVPLARPTQVGQLYELLPLEDPLFPGSVGNWRQLPGVYISSFRLPVTYAHVASIPAQFNSSLQVLELYLQEVRNRHYNVFTGQPNRSPFTAFKESLVAAAVFGLGNEAVESNPEARHVWLGYQEILRRVLPDSFGFESFIVRAPEVIVKTQWGREFALESVSGGIAALMEMTWQIFLRSLHQSNFTVLIDEPENHLHPSLQRELLPSLLDAFSDIRFVVSTHSPFVIGAVPEAMVYVLRPGGNGRITSELLDLRIRASSSERILREVLGVPITIPIWAEKELNVLIDSYSGLPLEQIDLNQLRAQLVQLGLEGSFPEVTEHLVQAARENPDGLK